MVRGSKEFVLSACIDEDVGYLSVYKFVLGFKVKNLLTIKIQKQFLKILNENLRLLTVGAVIILN